MNEPFLSATLEAIHTVKQLYPGKKELQKTVYLLQEKGIGDEYSFMFYFYGPYSKQLDSDIHSLMMSGNVQIKNDGSTQRVTPVEFDERPDARLAALITDFVRGIADMSSLDLERISTVLFLIRTENLPPADVGAIAKRVRDIKADKFSPEQIREAMDTLRQLNYIA